MASAGLLRHIPQSFSPPHIYTPTRIYLTWLEETQVRDWRGAARAGTRARLTGRQGCQLCFFVFFTFATIKCFRFALLYFVYVFNSQLLVLFHKVATKAVLIMFFTDEAAHLVAWIVFTFGCTPLFTLHGARMYRLLCSISVDHKMAPRYFKTKTLFSWTKGKT